MFRRTVVAIPFLIAALHAHAGGGTGYSATDEAGTVEKIVETRALPDAKIGAIVSYTRADGSQSFVEYAFQCDTRAYAYLGMTHDATDPAPNLRPVRVASDQLLENTQRPITLMPFDDPMNDAIRPLAESVCTPT